MALSGIRGLRAGRWAGRLLTAFTLWRLARVLRWGPPLYWGEVSVGVLALLGGLALWGWCGYRVRNPISRLELDVVRRRARLVRDGVEQSSCSFAELRQWHYREWELTHGHDGSTFKTFFAARCPALGEHDLFEAMTREACEAWVARVEAIVDASATVELDEPWGHAFDRWVEGRESVSAAMALGVLTGLFGAATLPVLRASSDSFAPGTVAVTVVAFGLVIAWHRAVHRYAGSVCALVCGAALASKPWVFPIESIMFPGSPKSPTSETGLYYLLPGLGLMALGVLLAALRPSRTALGSAGAEPPLAAHPDASARQEVLTTELPPPRVGDS